MQSQRHVQVEPPRNQATQFIVLMMLATMPSAYGCKGGGSASDVSSCDDVGCDGSSDGSSGGTSDSGMEPTCEDGIQNGDETGADCGGSCEPCAESTCDDGLRNGSELGIDCGGSCPNQDCCSNGYTDPNLGELGVDCSGECSNSCFLGTVYYVSESEGDDDNDGLTEAAAWQSLAHVGVQSFAPGDAVLFRRGDTWRESLAVTSSGQPDAYVTYGAYGPGDKPRILGSEQATGWTEVANDIWESSTTLEHPDQGGFSVGEVFFFEQNQTHSWGRQRDYDGSFSQLTQEYDWTWDADTLYVYAPSNPSDRYLAVEVPQRDSIVRLPDIDGVTVTAEDYAQYVAIDDLELLYARREGIYGGYNEIEALGLTITNCHIGYIGVKGGSAAYGIAAWHSDMLIEDNEIHDCGRRGISLNTYTDYTPGLTVENVTINRNRFYNGYHTTGPDISTLPDLGHTFTNITISNNIIDDTGIGELEFTSNSLYVEANAGNSYSNFYVYNNVIIGSTARAALLAGIDGIYFYHNSIYGSHPAATPYALVSLRSSDNVDFRNNIIYGTLPAADFDAFCVLDEAVDFSTRDYNLYFQDDPNQPFSGSLDFGGYPLMADFEDWQAETGWEANSQHPDDPQFVSAPTDLSLDPESIAVHAGTSIPLVSFDILGNPRDPAEPSLGAYE